MLPLKELMEYWQLIIGFIFLIAWLVRLESNSGVMRRDLDNSVAKLQEEHRELKNNEADKDRALWLKIEVLQNTLNQILISIGELKGRIEKN